MNAFRRLLKAAGSQPPIGTWIMSASPLVAEALGHAGFDWGVLDREEEDYGDMKAVRFATDFFQRPQTKPFFLAIGLWQRAWVFLRRAGTIIFTVTIVLWLLLTFPKAPLGESQVEYSVAGRIASGLEVVVKPIGFNHDIALALIPAMAAREVAVSALATANAIDISGFVLADGRRITVAGNWNDKSPQVRRFFQTIHASACKRFGTTLGPDYNAAHRDHFHLEATLRSGGRGFCR